MPQVRFPRMGSLEYWPRKRSKRAFARVRTWAASKSAKLLGFAGYKVGMTHLLINDNSKTSITKGMSISCPATIIECPPIKTASIRFYKNSQNGAKIVSEIFAESFDKNLGRTVVLPKKKVLGQSPVLERSSASRKETPTPLERKAAPDYFDYIRLLVYTSPASTGIGKKKPEVFEVAVGGNKDEQIRYAQEKLGKEIAISEVFKEGQQVDLHGISKGKGVQGPVKRFGISRKQHKTEKGVRRVGSLGGWRAQGHIMWRVAKAGKMGYHMRTEHNKRILKISNNANDINKKGGFQSYGVVRNHYIIVKGSVMGPQKRLIRMNDALIPNKHVPDEAPTIEYIHV